MPEAHHPGAADLLIAADGQPFRQLNDDATYGLDFDPRKVRIDLFEGWDREQEAYADRGALAFVSGPMYERHIDAGREITVPLGDLKFGDRIWRGRNRTAARQRAFVGIRHDGGVEFGYGELTPERARKFETFIGGLHSIYNDLERPPSSYKGAYSISMGQQIRYLLPRIRMVIGLRRDGRLEVLMSRDGLTLEQTRALARRRGLRAAYLPDHASKSRFILPGVKGFNQEDANWISGGATSFVHVPYLLKLSRRTVPLQGSLLAGLSARAADGPCSNPLSCGQTLGTQLVDRALAGLNRLMEQGVEPIARLIWAPKRSTDPRLARAGSPLREPPISADPLALRQRQSEEASSPVDALSGSDTLDLPPDLPPPLVLPEGGTLPPASDAPTAPIDADAQLKGPPEPSAEPAAPPTPASQALVTAPGAPPPPLLPPP
ncbi:MAG: hypothetical protein FJ077_00770 [Cyanobacteria bacterium K_DeepCast_35m_m2_023]|nr:hypothetical protein [Cyanobacteria bacterium K_DeepCast_35m_m2_023]